jgi:hypothetical protein
MARKNNEYESGYLLFSKWGWAKSDLSDMMTRTSEPVPQLHSPLFF